MNLDSITVKYLLVINETDRKLSEIAKRHDPFGTGYKYCYIMRKIHVSSWAHITFTSPGQTFSTTGHHLHYRQQYRANLDGDSLTTPVKLMCNLACLLPDQLTLKSSSA